MADVSAALCMSLGLIWFTLADSTVAPNFNLTGKAWNWFFLDGVGILVESEDFYKWYEL